jgi:hypothetical protein
MLYNSCTGIYKFGNNTYPRHIRRRSHLGNIFWEKSASYGPGNAVLSGHASYVLKSILEKYILYRCEYDLTALELCSNESYL